MRLRASRPSASPSQARVGRDAQSPRGDMLHPTHLALVTPRVDNDVAPAAAHGSPAAPEQAKFRRSSTAAEGAGELQGAPLFARTGSASSVRHGGWHHARPAEARFAVSAWWHDRRPANGWRRICVFHEGGIDALLTGA